MVMGTIRVMKMMIMVMIMMAAAVMVVAAVRMAVGLLDEFPLTEALLLMDLTVPLTAHCCCYSRLPLLLLVMVMVMVMAVVVAVVMVTAVIVIAASLLQLVWNLLDSLAA